ncbi:class I histocompatibility antigen, F10 alpha chain-like isoform X4 [Manacus candei]|uniref:class I histocompatibility antigen, F10 alpha chain-like isoform X4 n=1 Tax=Manacus candei TaxID=415023 RepID=UPI0022279721|nr:class I histocompatibility antigen, F10 alpha chain-like isoform X4 [Manacus candei]
MPMSPQFSTPCVTCEWWCRSPARGSPSTWGWDMWTRFPSRATAASGAGWSHELCGWRLELSRDIGTQRPGSARCTSTRTPPTWRCCRSGTTRAGGFDGQDFLSFELGSRSFVAADGAAQITKRRWESDGITVERLTNYLEHICPEVLQKHVQYGQEALEQKEPPDVHVSGKEEHGILTLSCHAYGFYPGIIGINWLKGDELRDQETEWGGIVPNSDGTFHSWARIEALPGEREQYRCRVEHTGMPEPGIFAWELESGWNFILVLVAVSIITAIIIILILMRFGVWKLQSRDLVPRVPIPLHFHREEGEEGI